MGIKKKNQQGYYQDKDSLGRVTWRKQTVPSSRTTTGYPLQDMSQSDNKNDLEVFLDLLTDTLQQSENLPGFYKVERTDSGFRSYLNEDTYMQLEERDDGVNVTLSRRNLKEDQPGVNDYIYYIETFPYDQDDLEESIEEYCMSRINSTLYDFQPKEHATARELLDNNMYGLPEGDYEMYREDVQGYINTYGYPWIGTTRAVFDMGDGNVLKIPLGYQGDEENWLELSLMETEPDRRPYGHYEESPHGIPVLVCEKVEPMMFDDPEMPDWADFVDGRQLGRTHDGRIVAYDV